MVDVKPQSEETPENGCHRSTTDTPNLVCKFWDPSTAKWALSGVSTDVISSSRVLCSSTHLTEFAVFEELECSGAFRWQLAVAGSLYCILVVMFGPSYNKIRTLRRSRNNLEGLQLVDQKYKMLLAVSAIRIFQMAVSVASWTGAADVQRALYAIFVCTSQVSRVLQSVGWLVGWLVRLHSTSTCLVGRLQAGFGCWFGVALGFGLVLALALA